MVINVKTVELRFQVFLVKNEKNMIRKIILAFIILFLGLTALKIFLSLLAIAFKVALIVGLVAISVVLVKRLKIAN